SDVETMRAIPRDADVLFVGTGLTMVDQVLTLDRAGHKGVLTAVSRHGLLPAAQPLSPPVPVEIDIPPIDGGLLPLYRATVRAAREAKAAGRDWRGIFEALRPQNQAIWQGLGHADRRRFMRHLEAYWSVHRHRMAPVAETKIGALRTAGRLAVFAGKVGGIAW